VLVQVAASNSVQHKPACLLIIQLMLCLHTQGLPYPHPPGCLVAGHCQGPGR
jgi:hypothetical protein